MFPTKLSCLLSIKMTSFAIPMRLWILVFHSSSNTSPIFKRIFRIKYHSFTMIYIFILERHTYRLKLYCKKELSFLFSLYTVELYIRRVNFHNSSFLIFISLARNSGLSGALKRKTFCNSFFFINIYLNSILNFIALTGNRQNARRCFSFNFLHLPYTTRLVRITL